MSQEQLSNYKQRESEQDIGNHLAADENQNYYQSQPSQQYQSLPADEQQSQPPVLQDDYQSEQYEDEMNQDAAPSQQQSHTHSELKGDAIPSQPEIVADKF